jgi:hypothetical protein
MMDVMRPHRAFGLCALVLLTACATNPLHIPPPPHALPSRPRLVLATAAEVEGGSAAESRPSAVPAGYAPGAAGESWRTGDRVAFALDFDDGPKRESFWLILEVIRGPRDEGELARAAVKTTLLAEDGTEIGTAIKRIAPHRIEDAATEIFGAYATLVSRAIEGVAAECIQDTIDEDLGEGSVFDDARRSAARELKRTGAPRFVRERLKEPAIAASIGSITVFDLAMAAVSPIELLIDVNRLAEEQTSLADFTDIPSASKVRVPLVMSIGGNILFRFSVTLAPPAPPYSLAGGLIEVAGVNEARGDRNFLVRLVGATRGEAPESRPAESRPAPHPATDHDDDP